MTRAPVTLAPIRIPDLDRRQGVYYGDSGRRSEVERRWRDRNIGLLAGEDEAGLGAVGFLNLDRRYDSIGGDGEG